MTTTLNLKNQKVTIEAGEMVSYQVSGHEYVHQKGSPGWQNSDTEMFPVIGPTAEAGYRVQVSRANAIQDQHGLLRELEYERKSMSATSAVFLKRYKAGTIINNSKFPERSSARLLIWPFDFQFQKSFVLTESGLEITFTVMGERDMPFMLGYHPAFKLRSADSTLTTSRRSIHLEEVVAAGNKALEVADCELITLKDEKHLRVKTSGFGHFMLWTEVPNMVCIEPITFYPYALPQSKLHEGFDYLAGTKKEFKVSLCPL